MTRIAAVTRATGQGRSALRTCDARRLGVDRRTLSTLVHAGVLRRPHRGVYEYAGARRDHATRVVAAQAAVTGCAGASHRSAAYLQGLIDRPPADVHLVARGDYRRRRQGLVVHRTNDAGPILRFKGVPCTSPLRTLVDLAATAGDAELDNAVDRALSAGLVRLADLERLSGFEGRRGVGRLRASLCRRGLIGAPQPSVLESRMLRLLRRAGLPEPRAEVVAGEDGRYRIDFAYVPVRLAMETYGYAWHHTPEQLQRDLERQRRLTVDGGWTVLAFTWADVLRRPGEVAAQVAAAYQQAVQRRR